MMTGSGFMIRRVWQGWTTRDNADAYERVVRGEVIPGIEARRIPGFRSIDLVRRERDHDGEFMTLMWFDTIDSVKAFWARTTRPPTCQRGHKQYSRASIGARPTTRYSTAANSPITAHGTDQSLRGSSPLRTPPAETDQNGGYLRAVFGSALVVGRDRVVSLQGAGSRITPSSLMAGTP